MTDGIPRPSRRAKGVARRNGAFVSHARIVPAEVPIAFSFGGSTYAVLMATPDDLEDFALGFCISEGIIASADEFQAVEIVPFDKGIDLQIVLRTDAKEALEKRRRRTAGPVGCGLCGIESIEQAVRDLPVIAGGRSFAARDIVQSAAQLSQKQALNRETRAVHGAGFYVPGQGIIAAREDVGRHNALDKLIGAVLRQGVDPLSGLVAVTSRVSVEMVQKTAMLGANMLVAVSAPTQLALEVADAAGMTVAAVVRGEEFELMTHPERVTGGNNSNVA